MISPPVEGRLLVFDAELDAEEPEDELDPELDEPDPLEPDEPLPPEDPAPVLAAFTITVPFMFGWIEQM